MLNKIVSLLAISNLVNATVNESWQDSENHMNSTESDLDSISVELINFEVLETAKMDLGNDEIQNPLDEIPELAELKNFLTDLNQLEMIPDSLEDLKINGTDLKSRPVSISYIKDLSYLNLSGNQLKSLPVSIGNLANLKSLELQNNKIISLPDSIECLINLENLDISANQLQSMPDSIAKLSKIKNLNLNGNQLSSLPESIKGLKSLESLHLCINQLQSIPESIGELSNLKTLDLSGNKLESLPVSIRKLKDSIEMLDLRGNQIAKNGSLLKLGKSELAEIFGRRVVY